MNVEQVESLLERARPAPPPPGLRRRIDEAVDLRMPRVSASSRRPRWMEVMTVAASILMLLATVSWLLREAPSPSGTPAQETGQPFENRLLTGQLVANNVSDFTWSADGKHWGFISPAGKEEALFCVVIDGKREKEYPDVKRLSFGADGRYVYLAMEPSRQFLVLNGTPDDTYEQYLGLCWSPDGKKLAYAGLKEGRYFVVEDGKPSGPYESVEEILWSKDSRLLAYSARINQDRFCVLDGKKGEPFDGVSDLAFAPDGRTLTYLAREGESMVVVGTTKGPEHQWVGRPSFSRDGRVMGYAASTAEGFVVLTGYLPGRNVVPSATFDEAGPPAFNRDGSVWAFVVKPKGRFRYAMLVVRQHDGARTEEMGEGFDSVGDPVLNAQGTLVAYAAGKGSRKYLVVGDQRRMKFSAIDRIVFDPEGKAVAFRAGQYGKELVVAGEARSDEVDEVLAGPVWSKDGKRVAFTVRIGAEIWSKVLDAK